MTWISTEEQYYKAFAHQDAIVRSKYPQWISIYDNLPAPDVTVQLLENDRMNSQDEFWAKHYFLRTIRVSYGMLRFVNQYGGAEWYRGYVGSSPVGCGKNVTHWQPLASVPDIDELPEED
jgi:hypothetical protein